MEQRTEDNANTKQQMNLIRKRQIHEVTTEDRYIERSNKDATNKTNQNDKTKKTKTNTWKSERSLGVGA